MNQDQLNEWLKNRRNRKSLYSEESLFQSMKAGDKAALARSITLLESSLDKDREAAARLINKSLAHTGKSFRIGITGVPGVGKSTFIEAFGMELIAMGHRVAVLAIDPSSEKTGGSILGDKTRMDQLSNHPSAFIRPSPAGDSLGGVARKTREAVFLCELTGFDVILIETVGVGQSETSVHAMVDFFLLLMLAGAGDELQGIKRGIMEMADLLLVTKADGDNKNAANKAKVAYQNALHLFPPNQNGWIPKAMTASSFENESIKQVIKHIDTFKIEMQAKGWFGSNRRNQDRHWFDETLKELVWRRFVQAEGKEAEINQLREAVMRAEIGPFEAAEQLFSNRN